MVGDGSATYSALQLPSVINSQGWVRTDGALVANTAADFTNGTLRWSPILLDEGGARSSTTKIWTGLDATEYPTQSDCTGFLSASGDGHAGDTSSLTATLKASLSPCTNQHRLLCISVGNQGAVRPLARPAGSKRIFLSKATFNGDQGVSHYDGQCDNEANVLPDRGTFMALLALTDKTALERTGNPYNTWFTRVDGSPVGQLTDAPLTFLNQHADGTFPPLTPRAKSATGGPPNELPVDSQTCAD